VGVVLPRLSGGEGDLGEQEDEKGGGEQRRKKEEEEEKLCVCVCEGGPKTKTRRIGRRTGTSWTGWLTLVVIFGWWITVAETKGFGNEETMCIMKS